VEAPVAAPAAASSGLATAASTAAAAAATATTPRDAQHGATAPRDALNAAADFLPVRASADVRELLLSRCGSVLEGVDCTFAGPTSLLLIEGAAPPEVQLARRCGAVFHAEISPSCTHILVPPAHLAEGTLHCERTVQLLRQAHALGLLDRLDVVDARWLLDSVSTWQRLPEDDYRLPTECLALPTRPLARHAAPVPARKPSSK